EVHTGALLGNGEWLAPLGKSGCQYRLGVLIHERQRPQAYPQDVRATKSHFLGPRDVITAPLDCARFDLAVVIGGRDALKLQGPSPHGFPPRYLARPPRPCARAGGGRRALPARATSPRSRWCPPGPPGPPSPRALGPIRWRGA